MEKKDVELVIKLMGQNEELKKLYDEHIALEEQLRKFEVKRHLTTEEEINRKKLQKTKLAGKDQILKILSDHRRNAH